MRDSLIPGVGCTLRGRVIKRGTVGAVGLEAAKRRVALLDLAGGLGVIDGQLALGRHVLALQLGILRYGGAATAWHRGHVGLWLGRGRHPRQIALTHSSTAS